MSTSVNQEYQLGDKATYLSPPYISVVLCRFRGTRCQNAQLLDENRRVRPLQAAFNVVRQRKEARCVDVQHLRDDLAEGFVVGLVGHYQRSAQQHHFVGAVIASQPVAEKQPERV